MSRDRLRIKIQYCYRTGSHDCNCRSCALSSTQNRRREPEHVGKRSNKDRRSKHADVSRAGSTPAVETKSVEAFKVKVCDGYSKQKLYKTNKNN